MTIWTPKLAQDTGSKYQAIAEALGNDVASGVLKPGQKLPTQRDLAKRLAVTIGTIGRAYALAEKRGLISLEVGRGSFVRSFEVSLDRAVGGQHIDLGLNLPPATEQQHLLAGTLSQLANSRNVSSLFGSAPVESFEHHRISAARWLANRIACTPDEVLICSGTQNALLSSLACLTKPGDSVLVEELTFPGMIAAARLLYLNLLPVAMDNQGMIPQELDKAAKKSRVLYCIPTNHNPTATTMSTSRRQEIAGIARKRKLVIIEDDVYGKLVENAPMPVAAFIPDQTFLICSLAKTMSVGLRLAFVRVPARHRESMITNMRSTNFFPAPLLCEIATRWIEDGTANRLLLELRETARRRQEIARDVLSSLPFRGDPVGNHIWIELPENWTAETLARAALENGVNLFSSNAFTVVGSPVPNSVRLALGGAFNENELRTGLNVVARLLNDITDHQSTKY